MQDNAQLLKHAISSQQERRVRLTFGKSQPQKCYSDFPRLPTPCPAPLASPPWGPSPLVLPDLARHSPGLKQYVVVSNTGVLPPPSKILPLLVAPTPAPMPVPVPVPQVPAPRAPPPRLPVPGTGVFLPPSGPGHFPPQHASNVVEKPNGHQVASPKTRTERTGTVPHSNGAGKGNEENVAAEKVRSNPSSAAET